MIYHLDLLLGLEGHMCLFELVNLLTNQLSFLDLLLNYTHVRHERA